MIDHTPQNSQRGLIRRRWKWEVSTVGPWFSLAVSYSAVVWATCNWLSNGLATSLKNDANVKATVALLLLAVTVIVATGATAIKIAYWFGKRRGRRAEAKGFQEERQRMQGISQILEKVQRKLSRENE